MTYMPLGQIASLSKPNGVNIAYGYEHRELLASRTYAQGSGTLGTDTFAYLPNHLLSGGTSGLYNMMSVSRGTAGYDPANRLIQETESFNGMAKMLSYSYTFDSLVSQTAYPDGTIAGRTYNSNRLLYQTLVGSSDAGNDHVRPGRSAANDVVRQQRTDHMDAGHQQPRDKSCRHGQWRNDAGLGLRLQQRGRSALAERHDISYGTMGEAYQYDGLHRLGAFQRGQVIRDQQRCPRRLPRRTGR